MKQVFFLLLIICSAQLAFAQTEYKTEEGRVWKLDSRTGHWIDPYLEFPESMQPNRYKYSDAYHTEGTQKTIVSYIINPNNNEECIIAYQGKGHEQLFVRKLQAFNLSYSWEEITPEIVRKGKVSILNIKSIDGDFSNMSIQLSNGEMLNIAL